MSFEAQQITVAVADVDANNCLFYENMLQDVSEITLLRDAVSSGEVGGDYRLKKCRRLKPRTDISVHENVVARIKRLKPLVVLVNMNLFSDEDQALLISLRRECADALIVLLVDDFVHETRLLQSLELGTRGYLKNGTAQFHLSKALQVVGRGDTWVPRSMLGNIMGRMLN